MRSLLRKSNLYAIAVLLGLAYPFLVYFGLRNLSPAAIIPGLLIFVVLRVVLSRRGNIPRGFNNISWLAAAAALVLAVASPLMGLKFYPIFLSLGMGCLFGYSLIRPPTVIERIARIGTPDLPPEAIPYVRNVTIAWLCFFLINAAISTATALSGDLRLWTLYNGFISYILMGTLFAVEFMIRRVVLNAHRKAA